MNKLLKLSVVAALSLVAGVAHADTISFSALVPVTATDFTGTAILQKFDTGLGTLNSVTFALSGATSVSYTLKNNGSVKHNYTVQGSATMDFTVPSSNVVEIIPTSSQAVNNLAAGATATGSFTGTASTTFDDTVNMNLYKTAGTGFFNNGYTVTGVSGVIGPTPYGFGATQTGSATFTVTYNYTSSGPGVPEPASIALLTMGFVGLVARRKR